MKYCGKCGRPLEDRARFCPVCGTAIETMRPMQAGQTFSTPQTQKTSTPVRKTGGNAVFVTFVSVLLFAVAALFLLRHEIFVPGEKLGPTLRWHLDASQGILTISGEGAVRDYEPEIDPAPWIDQKDSIRHVVVEEGITTIGAYAFNGLDAMTSVSLPETLQEIGKRSFAHCTQLREIHIPAGVRQIGEAAFRRCNGLINFDVDEDNKIYCSVGGALLNKDCTVFMQLPAASGYSEYVIPSSVTQIEAGAFYGCKNITKVTIPGGVTRIEEFTFCGCSAMRQIVLPMSVRTICATAFTEKVYNADGTYYLGSTAMKLIVYDGLEEWFQSIDIGADNDNLFNAAYSYVDPWDMPQSTVNYFERYLRNG